MIPITLCSTARIKPALSKREAEEMRRLGETKLKDLSDAQIDRYYFLREKSLGGV